jgi:transcriptional regulator with XRE-family HTH domain
MLLGELIEHWRRIKGITLRDAAKSIGIDHTVLHRLENNHGVDGETLIRVWTWVTSTKKGKK